MDPASVVIPGTPTTPVTEPSFWMRLLASRTVWINAIMGMIALLSYLSNQDFIKTNPQAVETFTAIVMIANVLLKVLEAAEVPPTPPVVNPPTPPTPLTPPGIIPQTPEGTLGWVAALAAWGQRSYADKHISVLELADLGQTVFKLLAGGSPIPSSITTTITNIQETKTDAK